MRAEQITDPVAHHGEGPCWSPGWGGLKYVDMMVGDVLTLHPDHSVTRVHCGAIAAALRPRARGGAVIALERGFALADNNDLSDLKPLPDVWSNPGIRFNDGGCDPQGRFYCGTVAYDEAPGVALLYRIAAHGTGDYATEPVLDGATISNGFMFSPDGRLAYYNDSPTRRTDVFDYDPDRGLTDRRPFAVLDLPDADVVPDGLCVDAEGCVWVALWGGSAVRRYRPDGALDGVVELPVSHVTSCVFGDGDLGTLFITSSREGIPAGGEPAAGALFSIRPGVIGVPALPFAG